MHDRKRIIIPILLVVILIGVGGWYWFFGRDTSADLPLQASGTIEAVEVLVAPEQSGRVAQVLVEKGQAVQANDELLKLDDVLLQSQHQRAQTALENANSNLLTTQTGLDMANAMLRGAETNIEVVNASTEVELLSAQQALDGLYDNHAVAKGETLRAMAAANRAVREAQYQLDNYTVPTNHQDYAAMEAIILMKERLDAARDRFEPYKYKSSNHPTREDLKRSLKKRRAITT